MSSRSPTSSPLDRAVCYPQSRLPVAVRRSIPYASSHDLERVMDIYSPECSEAGPAIVIATGYPKAGLMQYVGRSAREFGSVISWAQLLASHGVAAITYDAADPGTDLNRLIAHVRTDGLRWGIDGTRLGVLACSGNAPVALRAISESTLRCAILMYGFSLDTTDNRTAEAAQQFGFSNASAGLCVTDLSRDTNLLIVRAGQDAFEGLNETLDGMIADLLRHNSAVTIVNHATGAHAFDLMEDSDGTHAVIRQVLDFAQLRLGYSVCNVPRSER